MSVLIYLSNYLSNYVSIYLSTCGMVRAVLGTMVLWWFPAMWVAPNHPSHQTI